MGYISKSAHMSLMRRSGLWRQWAVAAVGCAVIRATTDKAARHFFNCGFIKLPWIPDLTPWWWTR